MLKYVFQCFDMLWDDNRDLQEFDTIARLETQSIDAYNDAHHYRHENPLAHLHEEEAPVKTDKLTYFGYNHVVVAVVVAVVVVVVGGVVVVVVVSYTRSTRFKIKQIASVIINIARRL